MQKFKKTLDIMLLLVYNIIIERRDTEIKYTGGKEVRLMPEMTYAELMDKLIEENKKLLLQVEQLKQKIDELEKETEKLKAASANRGK